MGRELLARWMAKVGWTQGQIADALGRSQSQVSRWLGGKGIPDTAAALSLEKLTAGAVEAAAWLTTEERAQLRRVKGAA